MIIENSQQHIIITFPKHIKKIGVKISGGLDSALILYIICKYVAEENPNVSIVPITIEKQIVKFHYKFSELIINWCKKEFPDVIFENHKKINQYPNSGHNTTQHMYLYKLIEEKIIDSHFWGGTANPPENIIFKNLNGHILEPPIDRKYIGKLKRTSVILKKDYFLYQPLININKKGVYEIYKKFGLLDTLFLLTRSCENESREATNNYTTHCGNNCWDCFERKWGFGKIKNKFDLELNNV